MSEEHKDDQITKEPEQPLIKQKDPKKVAAGKLLAQYHKKAKAALESEKNHNTEVVEESNSKWVPEISLTTALSLAGIVLTGIDLYFRYRKNKPAQNNETIPTPPKKDNIEKNDVKPQTKSKISVPRIGME